MKISKHAALILILWAIGCSHAHARNTELTILTGELPPYSYEKDGRQAGVASDIVRELMRRVGHPGKIHVRPWARVVSESVQDRTMSFPLARLPYREDKYCWIGPILEDHLVFAVLASNGTDFKEIGDFKHLPVGVNRGAPTTRRLQGIGFDKLQIANEEKINPLMLFRKRIVAWYSSHLIIRHTLKNAGFDESGIRIAFSDLPVRMYVTASPDLKDEVPTWQKALDEMKSDGTYSKILKKNGIVSETRSTHN